MNTQWTRHLRDETQFWRDVILDVARTGPKHPNYSPALFSAAMAQAYLGKRKRGVTIKILDVGSGPFSTLGVAKPGAGVEITRADALGDIYNAYLADAGLSHWPKVENVKGEDLVKQFGEGAFDLVNCANALDHFDDPIEAFAQMMRVCRPDGVVHIVSVENEGRREGYEGLHQWNITADDSGLHIADKKGRAINLMAGRDDVAAYSWEYLDHGQVDFKIIGAHVRKRGRTETASYPPA